MNQDNKNVEIENKQKENNKKIYLSSPKSRNIFTYLNTFRNESVVYKFSLHLIQLFNYKNWINIKYKILSYFTNNNKLT